MTVILLGTSGTWAVEDGVALFRSNPSASPHTIAQKLDEYWDAVRATGDAPTLPVLADVRELQGIDADGRHVLYKRAGEFRSIPVALVGRGGAQRLLFDFLFLVTRHRRARYFTRVDEARVWLRAEAARPEVDA